MKALLDTHAFLWWVVGDARLSQRALDFIAGGNNSLFLSAANGWEMAIKSALGRLVLPGRLESFVSGQLAANSIQVLPVQMAHALHVADIPPYHRDPFDRLLVAQAQLETLSSGRTARPMMRKWRSSVRAVRMPSRWQTAKLVQSVTENAWSLYEAKILQACANTA